MHPVPDFIECRRSVVKDIQKNGPLNRADRGHCCDHKGPLFDDDLFFAAYFSLLYNLEPGWVAELFLVHNGYIQFCIIQLLQKDTAFFVLSNSGFIQRRDEIEWFRSRRWFGDQAGFNGSSISLLW